MQLQLEYKWTVLAIVLHPVSVYMAWCVFMKILSCYTEDKMFASVLFLSTTKRAAAEQEISLPKPVKGKVYFHELQVNPLILWNFVCQCW